MSYVINSLMMIEFSLISILTCLSIMKVNSSFILLFLIIFIILFSLLNILLIIFWTSKIFNYNNSNLYLS
uniref:NADH dehydrogenase subunit 4L n=1 Tax=Gnathostomula armata TaxID=231613 RepID=A0A0F6PZP7_9BILA|nr:NADH dehydrogenase subunit 4L [Gnathostomula armata]AKD00028.1 NADH dehydrogenase subunit 4L [Gnathostomula armata]